MEMRLRGLPRHSAFYRRLVIAAACLTFVVVVLGAFVRLTDAGLGCPDWPGCYGEVTPVQARAQIDQAVAVQGGEHGPVSLAKAWKEMVHRYLAGALGLLILAITVVAWRCRDVVRQSPALAGVLLGVVAFQAALGMWTVTLLLKPVVVTLHLLGGMTTLALITWLALRQLDAASTRRAHASAERARAAARLSPWALGGVMIVAAQIALGGWVSSNHAALACIDFPTCHGAWVPQMDFKQGFQLVRELGRTADGGYVSYDALTAIHWMHRLGALVTALYIGALAVLLLRCRGLARHGAALGTVLALQLSLGVANIVASLPLGVALAHNAMAAALLVILVVINFELSTSRQQRAAF